MNNIVIERGEIPLFLLILHKNLSLASKMEYKAEIVS